MGKYTSILRGLPHYRGEDATQSEKVAAKRIELGVLTSAQAAQGYRKARDVKDALEKELEAAKVVVRAHDDILQETFEADGLTSLKLADGSQVSTFVEPYAQVKDPLAPTCVALHKVSGPVTVSLIAVSSTV